MIEKVRLIKEDEIEPFLFLDIYEALYFIILASPFKSEIENILARISSAIASSANK